MIGNHNGKNTPLHTTDTKRFSLVYPFPKRENTTDEGNILTKFNTDSLLKYYSKSKTKGFGCPTDKNYIKLKRYCND